MRNVGLDEAKAGIKIARRNINNLRYANNTTLMAESEEELKSLLTKVKEESEKVGLKFNIQKTKIMASGPITLWQIDGETVADFIFLGSKITADGNCSHEIKRHLLLGRKAITNLSDILKSRDIPLSTKVRQVKATVFPVVMYGCESWTIKKAEHWRINALKLWCWRRILRVPWTVLPFIGRTDAEASILWPPDVKNWLNWKDPDGGRRRRRQRMRQLDGITDSGSWWWTGRPGMLQSMGSQRVGHDWATEMTDWLTRSYLGFRVFFNLYYISAMPCGMQDLSSPTRDWTCTPCSGSTAS